MAHQSLAEALSRRRLLLRLGALDGSVHRGGATRQTGAAVSLPRLLNNLRQPGVVKALGFCMSELTWAEAALEGRQHEALAVACRGSEDAGEFEEPSGVAHGLAGSLVVLLDIIWAQTNSREPRGVSKVKDFHLFHLDGVQFAPDREHVVEGHARGRRGVFEFPDGCQLWLRQIDGGEHSSRVPSPTQQSGAFAGERISSHGRMPVRRARPCSGSELVDPFDDLFVEIGHPQTTTPSAMASIKSKTSR